MQKLFSYHHKRYRLFCNTNSCIWNFFRILQLISNNCKADVCRNIPNFRMELILGSPKFAPRAALNCTWAPVLLTNTAPCKKWRRKFRKSRDILRASSKDSCHIRLRLPIGNTYHWYQRNLQKIQNQFGKKFFIAIFSRRCTLIARWKLIHWFIDSISIQNWKVCRSKKIFA